MNDSCRVRALPALVRAAVCVALVLFVFVPAAPLAASDPAAPIAPAATPAPAQAELPPITDHTNRGTPRRSDIPAGTAAPDRMLVTMKPGVPDDVEARLHTLADARVVHDIPQIGLRVVEVAPSRRNAAFQAYGASPYIQSVEPDSIVTVADT